MTNDNPRANEPEFQMINDYLSGRIIDTSIGHFTGDVAESLQSHIENRWVPSLPLTDANKSAVAVMVAFFLIDQAKWIADRMPASAE